MPKGKGRRFTAKEHREAEHIIKSELARGVPKERAKKIAWATVNKVKRKKKD
jgi:hypothetical protein